MSDETVWTHWLRHGEDAPDREAVVHWRAGEEPLRWRWGALLEAVPPLAARLREAGVRKGDVCALLIRHHPRFYPLYLAVSALGALPAVLAYPNNRLHPDKFREGLLGMSRVSGLDWLLTEKDLAAATAPLVSSPGSTVRGVLFPLSWEDAEGGGPYPLSPQPAPGDPSLLQHSSGTTGLQKAVVLSHRAVVEHVRRYAEAIRATPDDRVVSWLPLYHDMGLIAAFYLPLTLGIPLVQLDPFEWVAAPVLLLQAISAERGTLSWLPNFAYNLMAERVHDDEAAGLSLASMRLFVNCSEPVRAESHDRFAGRFQSLGVRPTQLAACYAMAETTFAVTQTPPGGEARRLVISRESIAAGQVQPAKGGSPTRACVSSGFPIPGCALRVLDESGLDLGESRVGEIAVRSVSLFDGYRNLPAKTAEVLKDGWYLTGDYGFLDGGECFVVGRKKDLIIVAGNNIYPEDVEDALGGVPGVLPGRAVAFSVEDDRTGTAQVCVVAETEEDDERKRKALRRAVVAAGMAVDVTIARVYLAPPRWLIKSSAGKLSRVANHERALQELAWR